MTLQVLHAANELMDQAIDPNVACRERPIPWVNIAESGSEQNTIVQSREGTQLSVGGQSALCNSNGEASHYGLASFRPWIASRET